MKNKNDFFKTQGFYIALYCCVGVFLIAGIAISARNIMNKDVASEKIPGAVDETKPVGVDYVDPYEKQAQMQKEMLENLQANAEISTLENSQFEETKEIEETKETEQITLKAPDLTTKEPVVEKKLETNKEPAKESSTEQLEEELIADKITEPPLKEDFIEFTDNDKMSWPVIGEIAMDYSVDRLLYDKTLNMYKTNDSIRISGEVGSQVKATADGIVKSVTKDGLVGNKVVIDNGNGWTTTYGQLQDNVLVSEDTVVKTGQVIGGIANPTKSTIQDSSHLDFKIEKDNKPIDPKIVLAN